MSESEYTEHVEPPVIDVLSAQDEEDLAKLLAEEAPEATYHTILQVWSEILKEENLEANAVITLAWAQAIVGKYHGITFADLPAFRDAYFEKIREMVKILRLEIETDDECLNHKTMDEDRELNAEHYLNILHQWQLAFLQTELEWDCTADTAAIDVAVLAEVHEIFFGQKGLVGHLEAIKLEFSEADQQDLMDALSEFRANFVPEGAK